MENYYDVLGIDPDSNQTAIKSAFRRKAKKYHPDMAVEDADSREVPQSLAGTKTSKTPFKSMRESAMRLILEAYRILSDAEKRRVYDRVLRKQKLEQGGFDYRSFLKARPQDPESQAKLIVYDQIGRAHV